MSASKIQLKGRRRGFTLIEILIVVVILGILAAIVIPQFSSASNEAAVSSVRSQLQTLRSQVELFRVQNGGDPSDGNIGWEGPTAIAVGDGNGFQQLKDRGYLQRLPELPVNWKMVLENGEIVVEWTGESDAPADPSSW
jgi:type II secretion system protein G